MPKKKMTPVETTSPDLREELLHQLRAIVPGAFIEGKLDAVQIRELLGEVADGRAERYSFTWAGKRDAIALLQTPSRATLVPAPEESVDFETTGNIFIEGDNLEALKLLYKSYHGRIKMIYIDPPYNTGNDFIYPDNFNDPLAPYLKLTGQVDSNGNLLTSNPETSGRFHSAWLSMMYPRLFLARQILREDGVIFVSIDDYEARNLRLIMDEIFGEENFVAQLVWEKGRKNDAKLFSVGHEYMVVYARSKSHLRDIGTVWREPKPGAIEIWKKYLELKQQYGDDFPAMEAGLQEWYRSLSDTSDAKKLSRYKHIDRWGPWRDRDISWPGGGGPRYDVLHPKTKKPCKVPEAGWRFSDPESMQRQIRLGLVEFRDDHTEPPFRKAHLRPIPEELDDVDELNSQQLDETNGEMNESEIGMQVMPSYIYKQSQVAAKYLRNLLGSKIFDNPKDHEILARLVNYCTAPEGGDIILDFFAGSASLGEAVLAANKKDGGERRFILVQLPEPTRRPQKNGHYKETPAYKAGYHTISQLGIERLRRAIKSIQTANADTPQPDMFDKGGENSKEQDLGFKVFKLAESNIRRWVGLEDKDPDNYAKQMEAFLDPLVEGWQPENVIWEAAIREGYSLNTRIEPLPKKNGRIFYRVVDPDSGQSFIITLEDSFTLKQSEGLGLKKDDLFICRGIALDDTLAANLALQCRLKTI